MDWTPKQRVLSVLLHPHVDRTRVGHLIWVLLVPYYSHLIDPLTYLKLETMGLIRCTNTMRQHIA